MAADRRDAGSLFADLPVALDAERFDTLVERPGMRLERIVSTGQATPDGAWYDQDGDEWVVLLRGAADLLIEGDAAPRVLAPGDWVWLPAHCRHRVMRTNPDGPTVWLAIHFDPPG